MDRRILVLVCMSAALAVMPTSRGALDAGARLQELTIGYMEGNVRLCCFVDIATCVLKRIPLCWKV
jgi:hypothetical protein